MRYPNPDLLLYIGMADAYAMACEYLRPAERSVTQEALRFERYIRHPRHQEAAGSYTDDTEMSVANARVLIAAPMKYTHLHFADAYVAEFQHGGKRKGYSQAFQQLLESVQTGTELLQRIRSDSHKNGAAMRAVPIGILPTVPQVLDIATLQAAITHDTPEGRFSARAVALLAHGALYEDIPLEKLGSYCVEHLPQEDRNQFGTVLRGDWPSGRPVKNATHMPVALTTVHAVVTAVTRQSSLVEMMRWILRCGGDTDSVAAITWGIASCRFRSEALPAFLVQNLEGGRPKTGASYLKEIGAQLMAAYV